ncbi:MAG: zinc ribbon domain-containing protein [Ktedonobacteraceae bacterium]
MVFCGYCGYQLASGDTTCPRCGAEVPADLLIQDPEANNPTEMSQVVQDAPQSVLPPNGYQQGRQPATAAPQPIMLRSSAGNNAANDATTIMDALAYQRLQQYQPPQQAYPTYPTQAGTGSYGYNAAGQAYYPVGQSAVVAQILASSRKGKTVALLMILFGLLLLIAAIIVFLLNQQGIIFPT